MSLDAPAWLIAWLQSVNLWNALLVVAFVSAVIVFIRKKGWAWLKAFAKAILATADVIEHVSELPDYITRSDERFEALVAKVNEIHHETHKNDGSSIKDAVDRIESSVSGLHGRVDSVEREVAAIAKVDVDPAPANH
jgi:biopolymer transport protein ExbB/TolQ